MATFQIQEGMKFFDSEMGLHGIIICAGIDTSKVWWADGDKHSWCLTEDLINDIDSGIIKVIEHSPFKIEKA
tara:strand:- start:6319 stop:6534 length:216 start_codon:yes stop_codon:yes gene_type:complete